MLASLGSPIPPALLVSTGYEFRTRVSSGTLLTHAVRTLRMHDLVQRSPGLQGRGYQMKGPGRVAHNQGPSGVVAMLINWPKSTNLSEVTWRVDKNV